MCGCTADVNTYNIPLKLVDVVGIFQLSLSAVTLLTGESDEDVGVCPSTKYITRLDFDSILNLYSTKSKVNALNYDLVVWTKILVKWSYLL